ncbi:MAG: TIGR04084 family radical SAM/SPASM domain-containing protein, partial [Candidatus Odinarchaeota archaeon]
YEQVIKNIQSIRERGFTGDLVARMTVSAQSNIYADVRHLLGLKLFDHVHWQLDVFWTEDKKWKNLPQWVNKVYIPGISRLAEYWIEQMEIRGAIPGIVPFQGVMKTLLSGKQTPLPCGAGLDFFAINTSGLITSCPICPEWEEFHIGNIHQNTPSELRNSMLVGSPCPSCEIYGVCGGRCLFANKTNLWGLDDFNLVCQTVKHLVNEMKRYKPIVEGLISKDFLKKEDFGYPPYNNSCEIIP